MAHVRYGKAEAAECPCCINAPVDFDSEEGRERRRRCVRHYKKVSAIQVGLVVLALASGATSAGLAFLNPTFPYMICFPLISGVLMLTAAIFGCLAGRTDMDTRIPAGMKRNVVLHYVLCVVGCTICMMTAVFSAWGLGNCLSPEDSDPRELCYPHREVKAVFVSIDIVLAFLLFLTCLVGCVLFCMHATTLGFNRRRNMENELARLRTQVAVLSQAQQAQQAQGFVGVGEGFPPPPVYSEAAPGMSYRGIGYEGSCYGGEVGRQYGVSGTDFGGNASGQGQWPSGY